MGLLLSKRVLCEFLPYPPQYLLIRGAEFVLAYLRRGYPAYVVVLQLLRRAFGYPGVEEGEVDREVGVTMRDLGEHAADGDGYGQLLAALADERLFRCLARLDLAADELPQQPPRLVRRPLADHELPALPDEGRDNFGHGFSLFPFTFSSIERIVVAILVTSYSFELVTLKRSL